MRRQLVIWIAAVVALGALLLSAVPVGAAQPRTGETVIIPAGEVVDDDLVVSAQRFVLNGQVRGDLLVLAESVEINGTVDGDVAAAAAGVVINGTVKDDARIAGQVLTLTSSAQVGDDLMGVGGSLETRPGSVVGGGVMFGGLQALLHGKVAQDIVFGGQALELGGVVGGNVQATVGQAGEPVWTGNGYRSNTFTATMPSVRSGLTLLDSARIEGNLNYASRDHFTIPAGTVSGRTDFRQLVDTTAPQPVTPPATAWLLDVLRRFVTLLLVGLLIIWLAPRLTREVSTELERKPLGSLGWGLVTLGIIFVAFPVIIIATVLLAVLFGMVSLNGLMGIIIALGLLAIFALIMLAIIAIAYVAQIAVGYELGRLILQRLQPAWTERPYIPLALGLALLVLLASLPQVGWVFSMAAVLLGLGAIWLLGRDSMRHQAPAVVPA